MTWTPTNDQIGLIQVVVTAIAAAAIAIVAISSLLSTTGHP
ncbi:MAG: hypothetical protein V3S55_09725 [Nitrospiraceae bacterium]